MLRGVGLLVVGVGVVAAPGCSEGRERVGVEKYRREFVARVQAGGVQIGGAGSMTVERVDPITLDLYGVSIDGGDVGGMVYAERAQVVLDAEADTMSLRLFEVTGALEGEGLMTSPTLVMEAWPVGVDLVGGVVTLEK